MTAADLERLLDALEDGVRPRGARVRESEAEAALVVSCSMDGSDRREGLWPVDPSWTVRGVTTLGNRTYRGTDGDPVLEDSLAFLANEFDTTAVIVVGHTGCDVVADAYDRCVTRAPDAPAGIDAQLDPLVSLAGDAFDAGVLDESTPGPAARARLAEYNVLRQVSALRGTLAESVTVVGYVRDQDGAYGSFPGERYLVALDDDTDPSEIAARLPEDASVPVGSLL